MFGRKVKLESLIRFDSLTTVFDDWECAEVEAHKKRRKYGYLPGMSVWIPDAPEDLRAALERHSQCLERQSDLWMISPTLYKATVAVRRVERKYMERNAYASLIPDGMIGKLFDYFVTINGEV